MITDEKEGHGKFLAFAGLVVLSLGLGYSMGLNHRLNSPASRIMLAPVDPESIAMLKRAGQQAREAGDNKTAAWLEQACGYSSEQLLEWASAEAHGRAQALQAGAK